MDGDVVEDVFLLGVHPANTFADDDSELVGERGIVAEEVGDGAGNDLGMTVLVLETFAVEGGPTRRPTEKETATKHIPAVPDHIADPLKTENGVENVKRNGRDGVNGVGGTGGKERGHRAGLTDALLENLSVPCLAVGD